jgi:hypothetical protein
MKSLFYGFCHGTHPVPPVQFFICSLKPDMEMGVLRSKSQFVDFLATFIWHVTAGHKLNSDNVSSTLKLDRASRTIYLCGVGFPHIQHIAFDSLSLSLSLTHTHIYHQIHAFSDPEYSGVRMPRVGPDGDLPRINEVGSYIFGSAVGLLTSVRCPPLMADWMPLYSHLVDKQADMTSEEKEAKLQALEGTLRFFE